MGPQTLLLFPDNKKLTLAKIKALTKAVDSVLPPYPTRPNESKTEFCRASV
jgi:hypothetical protein